MAKRKTARNYRRKAKKELNKLDAKLKKRALAQKTFTRKLPPTAMTAISSMI